MKNIYLTLIIAIVVGITITGGDCDDTTGTGGGTTTDPNVLVFNNLVVQENQTTLNSPNAVDLLIGRIVADTSSEKDVSLRDLGGNSTDFYFRSGDEVDQFIPPGYETDFGQLIEWLNISQADFDTLSRIWKSPSNADTLTPGDFARSDTRYPGPNEFFGLPLSNKTVYGFYLKGKYQFGITSSPVYGMIRLDSAWDQGGTFGKRFQVDVKINVAGLNQFRKEIPAN